MYEHIDLFSGIGGFALAARWTGFKTVVFCEKDEYCQRVLAKNFGAVVADAECTRLLPAPQTGVYCEEKRTGVWNVNAERCGIPIIRDIRDFDGTQWRGATLLTGGFPCQPFSCAGKRGGKADDRFLWPAMLRIISDARPYWIIGENVPGIISLELDRVLSDLEGAGYAVWPVVIPAVAVNANHRRDRVWIVADAEGNRVRSRLCQAETECYGNQSANCGGDVSDSVCKHDDPCRHGAIEICGERSATTELSSCQTDSNTNEPRRQEQHTPSQPGWEKKHSGSTLERWCQWKPESGVGRVANGIPRRVDRLKGLGNAIVPQVAAELMRMIMEIETHAT